MWWNGCCVQVFCRFPFSTFSLSCVFCVLITYFIKIPKFIYHSEPFSARMMCLFTVKFAADASRLKVVPSLVIQYWLSVFYWLQIARMLTVKREREIEEGVGKRLSRKLDRQWKRSIVVRPPPSLKKLQEEEAAAEAEKSAWANCIVLFLNEFDVISWHRRSSSILLHWLRNFSSRSLYSSLCLILGLFFFSKVLISLIACLNVTIEQQEKKIPHNIVLFLNAAVSYSFISFFHTSRSVSFPYPPPTTTNNHGRRIAAAIRSLKSESNQSHGPCTPKKAPSNARPPVQPPPIPTKNCLHRLLPLHIHRFQKLNRIPTHPTQQILLA